jgi:HEAT repeat protein
MTRIKCRFAAVLFAALALALLTAPGCGPSHKELALRMGSGDASVRRSAAKELRGQRRNAKLVPIILQACRDEDVDVRMFGFYAMANVNAREEGVVQVLIAGMADTSVEVRRAVTASLGSLDPFPNTCVPYMVKLLLDPDDKVRGLAVSALADLQGGAVGSLMRGLGGKDAKMRLAVIGVLGQIGSPAGKPALPMLKRLAQDDEDVKIREAAERAVKYIEQ